MISCLWLESWGWWRVLGVVLLFVLAFVPAVPLFWQALVSSEGASLGVAFGDALQSSLIVAGLVSALATLLGLPGGVVAALYEFPGRRVFLSLAALPVLVPSFLWAIGWSALAAHLGPRVTSVLSGYTGCVIVFLAGVVPLVLLTSYASTSALSGPQIEAARLAGGEKAVLRYACGHVAVPALLAAGLGGVLTLSDPGPGQILGLPVAASEVLTSFAALYDFQLAGRQCAALAGIVLVLAAPLAYFAAPRLAAEMMARQTRTSRRLEHSSLAVGAFLAFLLLLCCLLVPPVVGLGLPVLGEVDFPRAGREVSRTGLNTLLFAFGAGAVATLIGFLMAFFVGRSHRLRMICLGLCLAVFALPPALGALGVVQIATQAPPWADLILRSRATVCLALGLRFFPVATVLALRAWGSMSPTWTYAAAVHGVPFGVYFRRVVIPFLLPAGAVAMLLVALLATADVGTVLLLHPPGESSLPLAIFTVMANAPESLVASLCLVYLGLAGAFLLSVLMMARRRKL